MFLLNYIYDLFNFYSNFYYIIFSSRFFCEDYGDFISLKFHSKIPLYTWESYHSSSFIILTRRRVRKYCRNSGITYGPDSFSALGKKYMNVYSWLDKFSGFIYCQILSGIGLVEHQIVLGLCRLSIAVLCAPYGQRGRSGRDGAPSDYRCVLLQLSAADRSFRENCLKRTLTDLGGRTEKWQWNSITTLKSVFIKSVHYMKKIK